MGLIFRRSRRLGDTDAPCDQGQASPRQAESAGGCGSTPVAVPTGCNPSSVMAPA